MELFSKPYAILIYLELTLPFLLKRLTLFMSKIFQLESINGKFSFQQFLKSILHTLNISFTNLTPLGHNTVMSNLGTPSPPWEKTTIALSTTNPFNLS